MRKEIIINSAPHEIRVAILEDEARHTAPLVDDENPIEASLAVFADLQHGNVMVTKQNEFRLVDYDGMCVPGLVGKPNLELGLPPYQHPRRNGKTKLSPDLDNFSGILIYVALRALSERPELWVPFVTDLNNENLLFTEDVADFDGSHYRLEGAKALPKPIQKPHPPIVIGGTGEKRTLRIAAMWADQWNLPGGDPDMLRHKVEVLRQHCADVGRDPAEIEVSTKIKADGDPGALADLVGEFREAGADHIIAMFEAPFDPAKLGVVARRLGPVMT